MMHAHRISSSPAPPGVLLSTIVVPSSTARGGGPLSQLSFPRSPSTSSPNETTTGHNNTSPPPPEGLERTSNKTNNNHYANNHNYNFSLTSNRMGGAGATFNSWDAAGDTSNLTFSQVSPSGGRQHFLVESDKVFPFYDADGGPLKEDTSPLLTKVSPRKRGEAAVKFAAFGGGSSAMESRMQANGTSGAGERQSVSWHPQGLFGCALERFQARAAASNLNAVTASMGGTVLGTDVPEDLPPEHPSASLRRRLSGPSVHAIQFDTDYGGNVTPFMSISSPGVSRRSISIPRMSVPQLSAGSMQMSAHSFERDASAQAASAAAAAASADGELEEQRVSLPPSSVASPAFNNDTVPAAHYEPPRSTRSQRNFSPATDSDRAQPPSSIMSPSTDTVPFGVTRSFRKTNTSAGSHMTIDTATTAVGEDNDDDATMRSRDFLMDAESATPTFHSTMVASSIPANSTTGLFESHPSPHAPLPSLEEHRARARIEFAQAAEFKKLRSLEVSESLARARKDRAAQRRTSKYAGDTLLRQLEAEEKEQLHSSMRARMRAAEAEHQQSMRELREKERLRPLALPTPPPPLSDCERPFTSAASSKRRASDTVAESRRKINSPPFQMSPPNTMPPLPPLASPLLSAESRLSTPHPPPTNSKNAEVVAEIKRQRELKQKTSFRSNSFEKLA